MSEIQDAPPPVPLDPPGLTRRAPLQPHQMTAPVTPTDRLFTLAHLGVARPQEPSWSLRVEGMVRWPLLLSLGDLRAMPQARLETVHQCAGDPQQPTVPTRRVACVVWEGVRLPEVLEAGEVEPDAAFVWADGADSGVFAGHDVPFYRKDVPLPRIARDVLLATGLNGAPIPDEHSGPGRCGWSFRASTARTR